MKRIIIGICDDEFLVSQSLKRKIEECFKKNQWRGDVFIFSSGRDLLEKVHELNVVFLDIEMPELDGIETGKEILNRNKECKIIMASGRVDKFKESFKIKALRFITKPFQMEEIEEALQAVQSLNIGADIIEVFDNRLPCSISQGDISYIVSFGSSSEFIVGTKKFRREITLIELEKIIDTRLFFRINRQYIVNMMKIVEYENEVVKLKEKKLTVSRRRKKDFETAYIEFDLKYSKGR